MIEYLRDLARGRSLSETESGAVMDRIMNGEATSAQIAGFAMALAARGETVDEIAGAARAVRAVAHSWPGGGDVLDTCGTGGDGLGTFNISTAAAIVTAACGMRVVKHGNRGVSSGCGSADVLQELGVRIDLTPEDAARCLQGAGITFLYAPLCLPSFRHAGAPRKELGARTIFNLVGPLANPAAPRFQIVGVPRPALVPLMAEVLTRLGVDRALVFSSRDGMDELSTGAVADVAEVYQERVTRCELDPATLGLAHASASELAGGDRAANASIIANVLAGERGPAREVVALNAAAALRTCGTAEDWNSGIRLAREAIDTNAAAKLLDTWRVVSHEVAAAASAPRPAVFS